MNKIIMLVLLLARCSEQEAQKVVPVYTSLDGLWQFTTGNEVIQFEVVTFSGVPTIDSGELTINGVRYSITHKLPITGSNGSTSIQLKNDSAAFQFYQVSYSGKYDKLTSIGYTWYDLNSSYSTSDVVVITR